MRLDRLTEMEHYIYQCGSISLIELASHFNVSLNTVRRDIDEIIKNKTIRKVYGGVVSEQNPSIVPRFERETSCVNSKKIIGRLAADFVQEKSTIFIDTGTTTSYMIPNLADKEGITIITNSVSVMEQVVQYPNLSLFSLGGFYNDDVCGFVGISVTDCLNRLSFDIAFLSAAGISPDGELTIDGYYEHPIKTAVMNKHAQKTYLLADMSKFEKTALLSYGNLSNIDTLITNEKPDKKIEELLKTNQVSVIYPGK